MFRKMGKNPYKQFEKRLGYVFKRKSRLETALVHRSYRFENQGIKVDNQRLEFFGDAVLGMVAAAHVYRLYQDSDEGVLTEVRSQITSGKALAQIGKGLQLGEMLQVGVGEERSGGRDRPSNVADALEAVIGAAYLDGGTKAVKKIFAKLFVPYMDALSLDTSVDNPKGRLQEASQRLWKKGPLYRLISQQGPPHSRTFLVEVYVKGEKMGRGRGHSKQAAEARAAAKALEKMAAAGHVNRTS